MTVSTTTRTAGPFTGTGVLVNYPFSFKVFQASDLFVAKTAPDTTQTTLVLSSDYTVTLNSDQNANPGGYLTLSVALPASYTLTITSAVPVIQALSLPDGGPWRPANVEDALDRLTILMQQQGFSVVGQSLRVPEVGGIPTLPALASRANTILAFDASGNPIGIVGIDSSSATALDLSLRDDTLAGKGAGQVGFAYALGYGAGTIGKWLKDLATSAGASFIGVNDSAGYFPGVTKTVNDVLASLGSFKKSGLLVSIDSFSSAVVAGNWSPAWQAAHDFVESLTNGGTIIFPPGFSGQFKTAIVWNPNKVAVQGNGALMDCSAFTGASYFITLRQTITDANQRSAASRAHPWEKTIFIGTGSAVGSVACVNVADNNPIAGAYWAAGVSFRDSAFCNWYRDFEIGNGGFFFQADNCAFYITGGSGYDTSIYIPNATNSGENINLTKCFLGKVYGTLIKCANQNASVLAVGCSADYTSCCFDFSGGSLEWSGYIESNTDSDYWVKVSGQNTCVRLRGDIHITGNKSAYELFSVAGTSTNGGLVADVSLQWGTSTYTVPSGRLIAGPDTARARVSFTGHSNTSVHPAVGGGTNALGNGGFESAALTDWTLTGSTVPVRVAGPARTGTYSLRFPGGVANTPAAARQIPCSPGQQLVGSFWYQTSALAGSGGTFYCQVDYLDKGGTSLQSSAVLSTTATVSTWTVCQIGQLLPAPAGTATASVAISLFGTTSGAPNAYIDDVTMAVV